MRFNHMCGCSVAGGRLRCAITCKPLTYMNHIPPALLAGYPGGVFSFSRYSRHFAQVARAKCTATAYGKQERKQDSFRARTSLHVSSMHMNV